MLLSLYQRYNLLVCLLLVVALGLACGILAATLLGIGQRGQATPLRSVASPHAPRQENPETTMAFILQHNLFNPAARSAAPVTFSLEDRKSGTAVATGGKLELLGTVVAGDRSLAVIRLGQEVGNYHLGAEIPGGTLEEIQRSQVSIRNHNRSLTILRLEKTRTVGAGAMQAGETGSGGAAGHGAATSAPVAGGGLPPNAVRSTGNNRWIVARGAAEAARENIGEQLRTALLQPNLINGKTDGFVVRRLQAGTLLSQMGLQKGDVIKRVNRMPLDSPEKALQIMQQLREARQLSVDLERAGKPLSFSYEIE